jgi:hypothetical protein
MTWTEQQKVEAQAPDYLCNVIQIISETGLWVYKELAPMKKEHIDPENGSCGFRIPRRPTVWGRFR